MVGRMHLWSNMEGAMPRTRRVVCIALASGQTIACPKLLAIASRQQNRNHAWEGTIVCLWKVRYN